MGVFLDQTGDNGAENAGRGAGRHAAVGDATLWDDGADARGVVDIREVGGDVRIDFPRGCRVTGGGVFGERMLWRSQSGSSTGHGIHRARKKDKSLVETVCRWLEPNVR